MEAYSSSSSSGAAAAAASRFEDRRLLKPQQPSSFHGSLHSVRKPFSKPWKKPIAPFPPTPPKVYTVDPINFRDLVQKLTASPEFTSRSHQQTSTTRFQAQTSTTQLPPHQYQRLQRVAPPPLHVAAPVPTLSRSEVAAPLNLFSGLDHSTSTTTTTQNQNFSDNTTNMFAPNSLGLNLQSPSSYNWCAFPILSPGTLSSLEQSTVP